MTLCIESLNSLHDVANIFYSHFSDHKVVVFNGEMGAGKTTFIKSLCEVMGVSDAINSPTFSIVNEYITNDGQTIFHFDCYRIESIDEAIDFGAEDYLYSGEYCFIEWAEKIAPLLPDQFLVVDICIDENLNRILTIREVGV